MNVIVESVHFKADQKLVDFCQKRVNKLDSFFEGLLGAEVTLRVQKDDEKENKFVEIKVSAPANELFFAKKQAKTFEEAVDLVIDALRKQIDKFKTRVKPK